MSKNKVTVELNRASVGQLLQSGEMQDMLLKKAEQVAGKCGSGYESASYLMPTRAVARISAATPEAKRDNLKNNTLLKALGSAKQ